MRNMRKPNRENCIRENDQPQTGTDELGPAVTPASGGADVATPTLTNGRDTYIINRYTLAAAAVGAAPLPGADVVAVSAVQANMVEEIAEAYGMRVSNDWGRHIAVMLSGSMVVSYGVRSAFSALKIVPVVGSLLGGGASVLSSALTTYAIGTSVAEHLRNGGTLKEAVIPKLASDTAFHARTSKSKVTDLLRRR